MKRVFETPFENSAWAHQDIEFALVLTQKRERILIGTKYAILSRLKNGAISTAQNQPIEVLSDSAWESTVEKIHAVFDILIESFISNPWEAYKKYRTKRDLDELDSMFLICDRFFEAGHFLKKFEYDLESQWEQAIALLHAALQSKNPLKINRLEKAAKSILLSKWETGDPVCQYASLRIWQAYLQRAENFFSDMTTLTRAFSVPPSAQFVPTGKEISERDPILRLPSCIYPEEEIIHIWEPINGHGQCAIVENSFVPLKLYYRSQLNTYGQKFRVCLTCGKIFLSDTAKKKLCSEACLKKRTKKTKEKYDEKVRNNDLESYANTEYQFWYRRVVQARKTPGFPEDRLAQIEEAFKNYRKESREQKKAARETEKPLYTFKRWASLQETVITNLMGEYDVRTRQRKY